MESERGSTVSGNEANARKEKSTDFLKKSHLSRWQVSGDILPVIWSNISVVTYISEYCILKWLRKNTKFDNRHFISFVSLTVIQSAS